MIWSEPGETKDWLGGGFWRQSENMVNERKERDQRRDSIVKRMRINTSVEPSKCHFRGASPCWQSDAFSYGS